MEHNVDQIIEQIYADVAEIRQSLEQLKGSEWLTAIPLVVDLVQSIVEKVEFYEDLPGEVKKEVAVGVLNKVVDIPVIPEFMEAQVFGVVIDVVVGMLNKWFGKNWLKSKE